MMMATLTLVACGAIGSAGFGFSRLAFAENAPDDPAVAKSVDGKYYDKDGNPTFHISADGKVDWYTYSGFRHYHSECHVCHGPYGDGSSYAPALKQSLKTIPYGDFLTIVANGRQNVTSATENVMPSFGHNLNVICHLDDIYVYLRARSDGALGRVRPAEHEDKPVAAALAENKCMAPD